MSLQHVANHLAQQGRGNDKMLVHMTPKEVQGLQALAHATGGSLTTNPHTGLPEAGFLESMLPTIIGVALAPATGGASLGLTEAWQTAALVGGAQALATGSIGKGLQAGLGAYGGASIGNSLANLGANALSNEATSLAASEAARTAGADAVALGTEQGLSPETIESMKRQAIEEAGNATARVTPDASSMQKLSAGLGSAANSPMKFLSENAKPLMYASAPAILAGMNVKNNLPQTVTQTGKITPYSYDPYSGAYTPAGSYEATRKAADGGLMAMANNNNSGNPAEQLEFNNEPVLRMAQGGIAHFDGSEGSVVSGGGGDAALAAYQAGDYAGASKALADAGMSAQDVVSKYGLSAADAATVAQNLGYTGNLSELNYGAPAAPAAAAPAAAAAATAPNPYTSYSNDQYASFFADPKNAAVLNTPGGLTAAETQFKADPAAVMAYLQGAGAQKLGLSAADVYQIGQGQGLQGVYDSADKWVAAHPNATSAEITQVLKDSGLSTNDVNNYFNRTNPAYGINQATGKAFTGAADIWAALAPSKDQGGLGGLAQINANINSWVATHLPATTSLAQAQAAMSAAGINELDVQRATGKTSAQLYHDIKTEQKTNTGTSTGLTGVTNTGATTNTGVNTQGGTALESATKLPPGVSGAGITTVNPNGTITTRPNIPGIPEGGFTGAQSVRNAWTQGGGSLGYIPEAPKTIEDFNAKYNTLTGGSKQALDYLTGKSAYSATPYTPTGEVMKPYAESVLGMPANISKKMYLFDPATKQYKINPDYAIPTYDATGKKTYNVTNKDVSAYLAGNPSSSDFYNWAKTNNLTVEQIAAATGMPITEVQKLFSAGATADTTAKAAATTNPDSSGADRAAQGGLMAMARGGSAHAPFFSKSTGKFNMASPQVYAGGGMAAGGQFDLGGYSDGGRLLRGPGDGVSDSIPATIGNKRPARLADGEFVVPARIVSELGNGSTEAGARKLYAMMDRVQAARKGSIGKDKVAKNSRADKYLPA